eukprot:3055817-Pleurochrysis_carterae.AAC.2
MAVFVVRGGDCQAGCGGFWQNEQRLMVLVVVIMEVPARTKGWTMHAHHHRGWAACRRRAPTTARESPTFAAQTVEPCNKTATPVVPLVWQGTPSSSSLRSAVSSARVSAVSMSEYLRGGSTWEGTLRSNAGAKNWREEACACVLPRARWRVRRLRAARRRALE